MYGLLFINIKTEYQSILILFLYNYNDSFYFYSVEDAINQLGNIIKTFGFSTESVTGFGKKGPNGPDYNSILALLGLNEINYTSDNDFFYQIKSYMNVLHPFYGIHPLPGTSLI